VSRGRPGLLPQEGVAGEIKVTLSLLWLGCWFLLPADVQTAVVQHGDGPAPTMSSAESILNLRYEGFRLCGVTSVYVVLRELRAGRAYEDIMGQMPPGVYGNSMKQIVECLRMNCDARDIRPAHCTARELYDEFRHAGLEMAVINLNEHWVVARYAKRSAFEIVDYPKKYFIPVEVLPELWQGDTVLVLRKPLFAVRHVIVGGLAVVTVVAIMLAIAVRGKRE